MGLITILFFKINCLQLMINKLKKDRWNSSENSRSFLQKNDMINCLKKIMKLKHFRLLPNAANLIRLTSI